MNPPFKLPLKIREWSNSNLCSIYDRDNYCVSSGISIDHATYLCQSVNHYQEIRDFIAKRCTKYGHEPSCKSFVLDITKRTGDTNDSDAFKDCNCAKSLLTKLENK